MGQEEFALLRGLLGQTEAGLGRGMEIPSYQPFYIESVDALPHGDRAARFSPSRWTTDLSGWLNRWPSAGGGFPNRFCAQPIAGNDAGPDGRAGGKLTNQAAIQQPYVEGRFLG